jgi:lysyl-tRNA synthetase class I
LVETSTITCPKCGHQATEIMSTDTCQVSYDCKGGQQAEAGTLLRLLLFWVSAVSAEQVQAN